MCPKAYFVHVPGEMHQKRTKNFTHFGLMQGEEEVREQARIVLTIEKGSGRAASSPCNAGHHGRERRIDMHTMEKGWVEGRREALMERGCKRCDWMRETEVFDDCCRAEMTWSKYKNNLKKKPVTIDSCVCVSVSCLEHPHSHSLTRMFFECITLCDLRFVFSVGSFLWIISFSMTGNQYVITFHNVTIHNVWFFRNH